MKKIFILVLLAKILTPYAHANLIFSEIAWMGSQNSSADEWIEIYNLGESPVSLDGYIIESQSKKILISLSGVVESKSYFLIERTDDSSEPTVKADMITSFGTGLNNSGDNIYLKNNAGQNIDSLLFSSGWPAGDNGTKQTMQILNGSWVTMEKTPKTGPANGNTILEKEENKIEENKIDINTSAKSQTSSGSSRPEPKVILSRFIVSFTGDQLANVPVEVIIDNREDSGLPVYVGGIYKINFGDGHEAKYKVNEKIYHSYEYPGVYRVTVRYFNSEWSVVPVKQTNLNIQITNPDISLDVSRAPIVVVKNNTEKDIDLGEFYLSTESNKKFDFPKDSIVFAGKELWLSPGVTKFSDNDFTNIKIVSRNSGFVVYQSLPASYIKNSYFASAKKNSQTNVNNKEIIKSENVSNAKSDLTGILDLQVPVDAQSTNYKDKSPNKTLKIVLFGLLVVASAIIFIKLRKSGLSEEDSFTLVDE